VTARRTPRLIAETTYSEVFHLPGDSDYCVITFSEHGLRANGRDFWGWSMLADLGIEAIGVVAREPHWFPQADFLDYAEAIRAIAAASGKALIGYGYSMGAYAAVKYAAALRLDLVLAYAPLWSIAPEDLTEFRTDWSKDHDPALHGGMAITRQDIGPNARLIIFADPCDRQEAFHIARIRAEAAHAALIPIRHAGHYIIQALAGRDLFQTILNLCMQAQTDFKRDLSVLCNRAKRRSDFYWYVLGERLHERNHPRWYAQAVEHAASEWPSSVALLLHLGRLRSAQGDYTRMSEAMARAAALEPDNPHIFGWWGAFARDFGHREEALGHFKRAYRMAPGFTHLEAWIAALS
jgi:tetratricopeptide (TPR) repeat protein